MDDIVVMGICQGVTHLDDDIEALIEVEQTAGFREFVQALPFKKCLTIYYFLVWITIDPPPISWLKPLS